jgi:rhamnosyltransferase
MIRKTSAIVTVFYPDKEKLQSLVEAISPQVSHIVVVDNGGLDESHLLDKENIDIVHPERNIGIAAAQNSGVEVATDNSSEFIVFFDQDSLPRPDLVNSLLIAYEQLESVGCRPAAVGPSIIDRETNQYAPFVQFNVSGVEKDLGIGKNGSVRCDFLVASGMLTSCKRFKEVGRCEEGLFIDNVDFEWCFRAKSKGYACFGVPNAKLYHSIGDAARHVGIGHKKGRIALHSPVRQYYIMRNRIHMYKRWYVPLAWKIQDFPRAIFKSVYFSTMVKSRWQNAKAIARGIRDGITNVYGPIDGRYRRSAVHKNISASTP